ncbi:MAG: hypothetical protein ACKVRN_11855 [Pyrinomonadaceae bacterium]
MKIAIFAFLLFTFYLPSFGQDVSRATWQVQKYDLEVTLPQDEKTRSVVVKAILNLKNISGKPASTLTLRISTSAEVSAVKINDSTADFTKSEEKITATSNLQRIVLRLASVAPDGMLTASVEYKFNLKENSASNAVSPSGAQFLPLSFWYPTPNSWYFTQGADAASVRLKVITPVGFRTLSSGSLVPNVSNSFDQRLNTQPFFVSGNWDPLSFNIPGSYGEAFLPAGGGDTERKNAQELILLTVAAKTFVTDVLGKIPNLPPLRIVAVKRGGGFSSGGTIFVDEAVFRRSKIDSQTAMSIAEAVAKLWLSNATTVTGDGYGAITEGLSRYIATQFIESKFGKDVADVERLRQRNSYAAVSKRDAPMGRVSPLDDYYYPEVANKGAMVWRILAKRVGSNEFSNIIRANMQDGNLNLVELRSAFSAQKDLLDYLFDQVTETNLMVGLPQVNGAEVKSALANTGPVDVTVDVTATTDSGQKITAPTTIKANGFGEVIFKLPGKVAKVEVDSEKLYPQTEYSDDIAPRETTDNDPLLAVKRLFDKQDFAKAEDTARKVIRDLPRLDDVRVLLARALLAQNKNVDAEKEFRAVMDEKLPTSRSLAWANVGLAEVASRTNQNDAAIKFAVAAIIADSDFGASLAARNLRNKLGVAPAVDPIFKTFFADFDKAATANRKADIDALVMPGEITKFASGVSGSTEQWQTQIKHIDRIDANTVLVETNMTIKLLNKNVETRLAVYRLAKVGNGWKLSAVDVFEVR